MGSASSSLSELGHNPLLEKLSASELIPSNEPFWNELLSFTFIHVAYDDVAEARLLEEQTEELAHQLVRHSLHKGGNLGTLLIVTGERLTNILDTRRENDGNEEKSVKALGSGEDPLLLQVSNGLFIFRSVLKLIQEHTNSLLAAQGLDGQVDENRDNLLLQVLQVPNLDDLRSVQKDLSPDEEEKLTQRMSAASRESLDSFFGLLARGLVEIPVTDSTYRFHLEGINTLITVLSGAMFRPPWNYISLPFQLLMTGKASENCRGGQLVARLLDNFCTRALAPSILLTQQKSQFSVYNATAYLASSLWSVVTLGYGSGSSGGQATHTSSGSTPPSPMTKDVVPSVERDSSCCLLATQSCLVLLILCDHCTASGNTNPYREALFAYPKLPSPSETAPAGEATMTSEEQSQLERLLNVLIDTMSTDETSILLFYLLYHRNPHWRQFCMTHLNDYLDRLTLPILSILYKYGSHESSHRMYMALILLLMFTEEEQFNTAIHDTMLKRPPVWLTELSSQCSSEISIGSVLVFLLIRTTLCHITRLKDKYLHTNCLAALANMSPKVARLHPIVCRKVVNLMHHLHRRHVRLEEKLKVCARETAGDKDAPESAEKLVEMTQMQEMVLEELSVLEELTQMVLEVVNCALSYCLATNPHLVYSLLCQQETCLAPFRSHSAFQPLVRNMDSILAFFLNCLSQECSTDPTEEQVMDLIRRHTATLSKHHDHKRFPELRFKYVEEESPEEFFVPYVWSLVFQRAHIYFNAAKIQLFHWPKAAGEASTSEGSSSDAKV